MSVHTRMLSLMRHVYSAAADEAQWPTVLEHLADESPETLRAFSSAPESKVKSDRHDSCASTLRCNAFTAATPPHEIRGRGCPSRFFVRGSSTRRNTCCPLLSSRRTEFYDEILRPAGVVHCFGACVLRRGDDVLSFTVVRSRTRGPYDADELTAVGAMLPHIQRAVEVNERLSRLERTRASLADGLDYLQHGVIVVNRFGRVIFANQAARAIVAQQDGLTIASDGLIAAAREDRRRLRSLLDESTRTTSGEGFGSGGVMTVARPSMKRPFLVLVAPLKLALDGESSFGMSTVFISDPEARVDTSDELTRRLYGLTATETRVASAFASTGSLEQAAEQLHISRETARWHLRHIYRKTGTNRQAALLKRLLDLPSRLRH